MAGIIADATEGAISRITDLLRTPDDLTNKLASVRRKFALERASIDAQLKTAVESQLADAQHGLDVLKESTSDMENVKRNMGVIDKLCADSQNTISNYAQIKKVLKAVFSDDVLMIYFNQLSQTHQNFKATKDVIDQFQRLNSLVERIQQLLDHDAKDILGPADNLLLIHYQIFQLELFRNNTMLKSQGSSGDVINTLNNYFQKVDQFAKKFEEYIWELSKNLVNLVKRNNGSVVVRLVKIIETEEKADELISLQEVNDENYSTHPRSIKGYRIKFFDIVRHSIESQIEDVYVQFKSNQQILLKELDVVVDDLVVVHDELVPLFPKRYNIFQFFVLELHRSVHGVMVKLLNGHIEPASILMLLKWVRDYYGNMSKRLGVGEELLEPHLLDNREDEMIQQYVELVHQKLSEWLSNLLKTDIGDFIGREKCPEADGSGMYLLSGSVIVFQMFNQQVDIVLTSNRGQLLYEVVTVCTNLIEEFQSTWMEVIEAEYQKFVNKSPEFKGGIVEYLVALANDSMRSSEFSETMLNRLEPVIDLAHRKQIIDQINQLRNGFMKLAKRCYTVFIDITLIDCRPAFIKLYCAEWYEQDLVKLIIGTMEDYCEDIQAHMTEYLFSKFTADLLDRYLITSIEAMRNRGGKFKMPGAVDKMKVDIDNSIEFFSRFKNAKRVKGSFDVMEKLWKILECNPRLAFLEFYTLWKAYPDVPIVFVEDVLQRREDLDKATLKEVIESIRTKTKEERGEEGPSVATLFSKINTK
ncbi:SNARE-binding exocyst subunit S6 [Nowakowskiella sp. JEL0407]|nr:SNARE-binding exocyst subunit S6 [Nowakowskiella sp. JEL0407]